MQNKTFVKTFYPYAYCVSTTFKPREEQQFSIFVDNSKRGQLPRRFCIGEGATPKLAWADIAKDIMADTLERFEN